MFKFIRKYIPALAYIDELKAEATRFEREASVWYVRESRLDRLFNETSKENKELQKKIEDLIDPGFDIAKMVHDRITGMDCSLHAKSWAIRLLAMSFRDTVGDAENFMTLECGTPELGFYVATVQRKFGKSPAQIIGELQDKIEEHEFRIGMLTEERDILADSLEEGDKVILGLVNLITPLDDGNLKTDEIETLVKARRIAENYEAELEDRASDEARVAAEEN